MFKRRMLASWTGIDFGVGKPVDCNHVSNSRENPEGKRNAEYVANLVDMNLEGEAQFYNSGGTTDDHRLILSFEFNESVVLEYTPSADFSFVETTEEIFCTSNRSDGSASRGIIPTSVSMVLKEVRPIKETLSIVLQT